MIEARAIAVQGYGYGALAIAERGYIGVVVLKDTGSGGVLDRGYRGGATEVMAREVLARQDAERQREAAEAAELETAELLERIARNSELARRRNEAFQKLSTTGTLVTSTKPSIATNLVAANAMNLRSSTVEKLKDNQNRAAILLALLMA